MTLDARTPLEDRLAAALVARSELVAPELLARADPVVARPRSWRRPAQAVAAAVLVVAVPTLTVLALTRDDRVPALSSLPGNTGMSVPADVDGDGDSDLVRLSDGGTLTIDRGPDGTSVAEVPSGSRLLGAAYFGSAADVVVAVPAEGDNWSVRLVTGEGKTLSGWFEPSPPRITETSTVWVERGVLYVGTWAGSAVAGVPVTVQADLIEAGYDSLIRRPAGELCWDRPSQPYPRACASGGPPATPRPELPAMYPAQELALLRLGDPEWTDHSSRFVTIPWTLGLRSDGANVELTARLGQGPLHTVVVPGPDPAVVKVDVGTGFALVVHGTHESGQVAELYALFADGLAPVPVRSEVPLLRWVAPDGQRYEFWIAEDGVLYSRLSDPQDPTRGEVWRWRVADRRTGPHLVASPLGTVCVDSTTDPVHYGRC